MYTAEDITWYNQNQAIPREMYFTISDKTSVLVLQSMQFTDAREYSCRLDNGAVSTIQIRVGTVPKIANFSSQASNMKEVWCTWDPVPSNLPTTYVFTYQLRCMMKIVQIVKNDKQERDDGSVETLMCDAISTENMNPGEKVSSNGTRSSVSSDGDHGDKEEGAHQPKLKEKKTSHAGKLLNGTRSGGEANKIDQETVL
ncbi:uncharacterized protein [Ptychodera flava]|uniref:uncharacterized protein n=1 Tax=Ptychodera flava TaxID=63121 RepID=UPI00396A5B06